MRKTFFLALIWSQITFAINNPPLDKNLEVEFPLIVRVYFDEANQISVIDRYADVWDVNKPQQFATVQIHDQITYKKLLNSGLKVHIDTQLMNQHAKDLKNINNAVQGSGIPGYACYSTVEETFARMDQMVLIIQTWQTSKTLVTAGKKPPIQAMVMTSESSN